MQAYEVPNPETGAHTHKLHGFAANRAAHFLGRQVVMEDFDEGPRETLLIDRDDINNLASNGFNIETQPEWRG
jgi:hypothetical protein